tara:strand:- start:1941 stop:2279 length:339 start_codon:yes stop_codon:yes gene_type:complete
MATSGKYVYWNTGEGANATGEAVAVPVESFRGFDCQSGKLLCYFEPLSDTQANRMLVTVTVTNGKQIEVAKAICQAFASANAGVIVIADEDQKVFLHADITGVADNSAVDAE